MNLTGMSLVYGFGGLVLGFVLGIGAAIFYLRWKMKRQLGNVQEQMSDMMDMTGEMDDLIPEETEE